MTDPTQPPADQPDPNRPPAQPPSFEKQPPRTDPAAPPYGPPPGQGYPPPPGYGTAPGYGPPLGQGYPPSPGYGPPPGQGYPPPPGYGYPAAPPSSAAPVIGSGGLVYDPNSSLYLPAGTELASVGRRIGAYFLALPLFIVTLGIGYLIWGLILWGDGTTPALKVLGMRCYRPEQRQVPGFWWMALREVIGRLADGILSFITGIVSFVLFVSTDKRQSLHDLVAGTVVLHDPNKVLA